MLFISRYKSLLRELPVADRVQLLLSTLIRFSLVIALLFAIAERNWTTVFVCVAALCAAFLPLYLASKDRLSIPVGFEFLIVLFVYATLFLGEVHGFYTRFWWWDVVLHTGSGIAFGFIGFLILYSFHRTGRFQAPPALIAAFAFSVSLAIGVLWEIFEFAMDSFFGFNMQKSGLVDTMWDLIVNTAGAFIASVSGYLYLRYRTKGLGVFRYYLSSYFSSTHDPKRSAGDPHS